MDLKELDPICDDIKGLIWKYCSYFPFKDDVKLKLDYKYNVYKSKIKHYCMDIIINDGVNVLFYDDKKIYLYNINEDKKYDLNLKNITTVATIHPLKFKIIDEILYISINYIHGSYIYEYDYKNTSEINLILVDDAQDVTIDFGYSNQNMVLIKTHCYTFNVPYDYSIKKNKELFISSIATPIFHKNTNSVYFVNSTLYRLDLETEETHVIANMDECIIDNGNIVIDELGEYISLIDKHGNLVIYKNGKLIKKHNISEYIPDRDPNFKFHNSSIYIYNTENIIKLSC